MKVLLLLIPLLVLACANVKEVDFEKTNAQEISDINADIKSREVLIQKITGDSLRGKVSALDGKTLILAVNATTTDTVTFQELKSISYRSKSLGTATYGVLGLLAACYVWNKMPEGPGFKVGHGILHWAILIPLGTGYFGYNFGRTERYENSGAIKK